jgi:hypothetical protein
MRTVARLGLVAFLAACTASCGADDEDGRSTSGGIPTSGSSGAGASDGGASTSTSTSTSTAQGGSGNAAGAGGVGGTASTANGGGGASASGGSGGGVAGGGGSGSCQSDADCSDGFFCNGAESCSAGACAAGTSPCNDGISCTVDVCDEAADSCGHDATDSLCDNNVDCDGAEFCNPMMGCLTTGPTCDDGKSCTVDQCDIINDVCTHSPNDQACSNGLYCDGEEACDPVNGNATTGCVAGTTVNCDDTFGCTTDSCNEAADACAHAPSDALCAPGQYCVPGQGCKVGTPCTTNAQCSDGNACNGVETCNVVCQIGQPVNCSDGIQCTTDSCNPSDGSCSHQPNHAACDDQLVCNGAETCSAQAGCVAGTAVACADNVPCTLDQCQEPGVCVHLPQAFACDDGNICNGAEACTATGCQPGSPFVCPPDTDNIACTSGACDPLINACKSVPNDSLCPCGQTCNPTQGGCGFFCVQADCQGKLYACGECADNDGDCKIDSADASCLGPCDNTEDSFYGGIPGQANSPCKQDCYFDKDSGAGNDDCYWSHECDTYEVPPNYSPEGSECAYDPNVAIPGFSGSCADAFASQSQLCLDYCQPLTPNGCDCFGCCVIPGAPTTVWLGSENPVGTGSCNLATVNDPTKCKPCTQVPSCINPCANCEICVGKTTLPIECVEQECPAGKQKCGLAGQQPCPAGSSCITGCCQLNPG